MLFQNGIHSTITLRRGRQMPCFGLGVYKAAGEEVGRAICNAVEMGYRMIDTAQNYGNEEGVGAGLRACGAPREELFITTKLWVDQFARAAESVEESLRRLDTEYVDLLLLHWPGTDAPARLRAWDALLELREAGKIRCCGVSNFTIRQLKELREHCGEFPENNQIELHPWNQKRELRAFCDENRISVTAWGPLFHGHLAEEPLMFELAEKYGRSAAQVTLRWHIQHGNIIIPKSARKERIRENTEIFDFAISHEDMARIDALDGKGTFCWDPEKFDGDLEKARRHREETGSYV